MDKSKTGKPYKFWPKNHSNFYLKTLQMSDTQKLKKNYSFLENCNKLRKIKKLMFYMLKML